MEFFCKYSWGLDAVNCFREKNSIKYVWEDSNYASLAVSFSFITEAEIHKCTLNKVLSKILEISLEKHMCWSLFCLTCVESLRSSCLQIYLKKTPTQLFSCEIGKIFSSSFLTEHLRWEAIVLEIHRKLTCGSSFCNVGRCKTQIYLKSLRKTSSKSQLFKLTKEKLLQWFFH